MSKFLGWLKERLKPWIKPATSVLISALSDLTRSRTDLVIENALLRQQLIILKRQLKRPQLTNPDRFRLVFLSLCWLLVHPPCLMEKKEVMEWLSQSIWVYLKHYEF